MGRHRTARSAICLGEVGSIVSICSGRAMVGECVECVRASNPRISESGESERQRRLRVPREAFPASDSVDDKVRLSLVSVRDYFSKSASVDMRPLGVR